MAEDIFEYAPEVVKKNCNHEPRKKKGERKNHYNEEISSLDHLKVVN